MLFRQNTEGIIMDKMNEEKMSLLTSQVRDYIGNESRSMVKKGDGWQANSLLKGQKRWYKESLGIGPKFQKQEELGQKEADKEVTFHTNSQESIEFERRREDIIDLNLKP